MNQGQKNIALVLTVLLVFLLVWQLFNQQKTTAKEITYPISGEVPSGRLKSLAIVIIHSAE